MTRVKSFYTFLDFLKDGITGARVSYPVRDSLPRDHYKINLHNPSTIKEIEYEKFDYNIIKPNINPFADALVNEMWPFFRMIWRTRGGYDAEIKFNPEIDLREFGTQFGPGMYTAVFKFNIDDLGIWKANFNFEFNQKIRNPDDDHKSREKEREGAFYAQDYSRITSNTAKRARKLAKPNWSVEDGRDDSQFGDMLKEEVFLNQNFDFSFIYQYIGEGNWGNTADYEIAVPNKSSMAIPEKEVMFAIPISSIKKAEK
jgi:hypothetical protein